MKKIDLKGKSILSMLEYSSEEIDYLIKTAIEFKRLKNIRRFNKNLLDRNFVCIFDRPSCRTRASFVVAASDEGAHLEIFPGEDIRFGIKESVKDIARVLGRLFDGIAFRGQHHIAEQLVKYSGIPVWNGLSEQFHPTQALADLMTIKEKYGKYKDIKMAYIGDGRNNVVNSLIIASFKMGIDFRIIAPVSLSVSQDTIKELKTKCTGIDPGTSGKVAVTSSIKKGIEDCDVVYGDVWVSMGEEAETINRIKTLKNYKVTRDVMKMTGKPESIYMHCMPAFHDHDTEAAGKYPGIMEVEDEVFESSQSLVFEQSENRMHTIKALMTASINGGII
jgi:ornithine carbamoyltransferase